MSSDEETLRSDAVRGMIEGAAIRAGIIGGVGYLSPEDVRAELMATTVACLRTYDKNYGAKFSTYLWPRLRGCAFDLRRRHGRLSRGLRPRPSESPIEMAVDVAAPEYEPEERLDVEKMMGRLPPRERMVLLLMDVAGETAAEAAIFLGAKESQTLACRKRALRRLRVALGFV